MVVEGEAVVDACMQHEEVVLRYLDPIAIIREGERRGRRRNRRKRSKGDGRQRNRKRRRKVVVVVGH